MKLLLDTCTFLWACSASEELSAVARAALEAPGNALYFSAASAWEIAVKHALGKLPLPAPPNDYVPEGRRALAADMLAIEEQHAFCSPSFRTYIATRSTGSWYVRLSRKA